MDGRLPDDWFKTAAEITVDREEILVVGRLPAPTGDSSGSVSGDNADDQPATAGNAGNETASTDAETDTDEVSTAAGEAGRIARFREQTRRTRMRIADEAEYRFGRKVAWGAICGGTREVFTNLAVPVMTRLRQADRMVLDTLVDAGVARSRSEALAWSVRLVGKHQQDWIAQLREALVAVEEARAHGPD